MPSGAGQIFISFRHTEPDESLAKALAAALRERGHAVFIDHQIEIGVRWVEEIERQLRASSFFVVLLSQESIRSDMVRQEVALAHELERKGKMVILPVRMELTDPLPYDLASYLDRIQYATWRREDKVAFLCATIVAAVERTSPLPHAATEPDPDQVLHLEPGAAEVPMPAADPRVVLETGTMRLSSPFYVRRPADTQMERVLALSSGDTLVIKGARQNGKSSLLARAQALCLGHGRRAVYLDLQQLDADQLASLDTLLRALALRIARALRTLVQVDKVWDEGLGAKESFVDFLETAVLANSEPVLLALDEVDRIFDQPYRNDFFAAVRGWHNNRAIRPAWDGLHLAIAHATDPALWIDNLSQSPFNVGERLHLPGFTAAEIADLDRRHGRPLGTAAAVDELRRLVGGQPYLVRRALYILATTRLTLAELHQVATDDRGPFGDHLRQRLWALNRPESRAVVQALKEILRHGRCTDEMAFQRLQAAGLVEGTDRESAAPSCELYRGYFTRHLP